ncbi:hypothetical protein [Colwellia sp. RSH04]|uniref:hypothetical protein n=1 Tax=Colwellia sp. RSH04 TaxID=2305464 RepID=UPI000E595B9E|nr:hypothetical protein [Colwellia sp. RSH04]RHW77780.1 hypothetical protein D1094_02285 [Colwellia sp. RSH04]
MFSKVALIVLLVVSIVLQSLTAVASAINENHQIDVEHIQVKHDHNLDRSEAGRLVDAQGHDVNDCHHCGHCSGSHLTWILIKDIPNLHELPTANEFPYDFIQYKEFFEAILRPPIS